MGCAGTFAVFADLGDGADAGAGQVFTAVTPPVAPFATGLVCLDQ
jgi:hypothetical protein